MEESRCPAKDIAGAKPFRLLLVANVAKKHCRCKPPRIRGGLQSKERASTFRSTNASRKYKFEARSISEWFRPVTKQYPALSDAHPYELYPLSKFLIIFTFFTRIPGFKVLLPSIIPTRIPISPNIPTFRCTSTSTLAAGPSLALLTQPAF
jgi:hypothetical protein